MTEEIFKIVSLTSADQDKSGYAWSIERTQKNLNSCLVILV